MRPRGKGGDPAGVRWGVIRGRPAPAAELRAALRLVALGEEDLGVVHATDATVSARVVVVATIPAARHTPIRHPVAPTINAAPAAAFPSLSKSDPGRERCSPRQASSRRAARSPPALAWTHDEGEHPHQQTEHGGRAATESAPAAPPAAASATSAAAGRQGGGAGAGGPRRGHAGIAGANAVGVGDGVDQSGIAGR